MVRSSQHSLGLCELVLLVDSENLACSLASKSGALPLSPQTARPPPRDEDPIGAAPPLLVCERLEPIQFQRGAAHPEKLGRAGQIAISLAGERVSSVVRVLLAAHSEMGGASGRNETSGARRVR